jgi:hypothetical protein
MSYTLDHTHAEDLAINSISRCVRSRLYFTSESHLYTLLHVLRHAPENEDCCFSQEGIENLDQIPELSYLTQVVIRLFEQKDDSSKFRCEISMSPGAVHNPKDLKHAELAPYIILNKSISADLLLKCLDSAIHAAGYDVVPDLSQEQLNTGNTIS